MYNRNDPCGQEGPIFRREEGAVIGRTIAHYKITAKIGEGGMGVVYKARDTHLDRFIAIKILPPERVASPDRKRRFVQEAKSASALNHPNIIHIYDIDSANGIDFMVMEYVPGKTLDELIPRKGMPLNQTLKVAVQVADALTAAHQAGIVHRDLKPGNIMVGDDGRVRVLDFGLAKLTEADPESDETRTAVAGSAPHTEEGTILGTVSYMSPEQAKGRAVDARSDIFSFGSVLYEMVTGRRAFRGDSAMSTLGAIIHKDPEPLGIEIPHEVNKLITRCLRKDLGRRFQHMDDIKIALEELKEESDSGTLARAPGAVRTERRAVPLRLIGAAAVVVLLAAAGWFWFERYRPTAEEAPLTAVPLTSFPGNEQTPTLSPDGNQVAFSWDGEAQDNYDIYVQVIGSGEPLQRTTDPAFDWAPAWSPDGREIVFLRYWREGRLAVVSIPPLGGQERMLLELPITPDWPRDMLLWGAPTWSTDGEWVASTSLADGLVLSRAGSEVAHTVTDLPGGMELYPTFAPDGRSLAFVWMAGWGNTDLHVLSLTPGLQADGEPKRLTAGMRLINKPQWTQDGREIIFSAATEAGMGLWRIEAAGISPPRRLALVGEDAWSPSVSRDGRRLVYERRTANSSVWRLSLGSEGSAAERIISSTRSDESPSYSPDGTRIVFSSTRSGSWEIWRAEADGSSAVQLTSLGRYSSNPDWSPDGKQIVFGSTGGDGYDVCIVGAEGGVVECLIEGQDTHAQPSWSPDPEWIYFRSNQSGTDQIWRIPSQGGDAVQVTKDGAAFARVSPDGSELYFTRGDYGSFELWRMPVAGGSATRVDVPSIYDWRFEIAGECLYFTTPLEGGTYPVVSLDLSSGETEEIARISFSPWARFSMSPDGRWLTYDQLEQSSSDLMLVENFR